MKKEKSLVYSSDIKNNKLEIQKYRNDKKKNFDIKVEHQIHVSYQSWIWKDKL